MSTDMSDKNAHNSFYKTPSKSSLHIFYESGQTWMLTATGWQRHTTVSQLILVLLYFGTLSVKSFALLQSTPVFFLQVHCSLTSFHCEVIGS